MPPDQSTELIARAIQLSVAPVFLLTGIAGLLGVMATRLARVIDRARSLEGMWSGLDAEARVAVRSEVACLEHRRRVVSWSINFCTAAALLVCVVIVILFVEEFFVIDLRWVAGSLFVAAMVAVIFGLSYFLREVYLATHSAKIELARFE
jgi:hypothetical protein